MSQLAIRIPFVWGFFMPFGIQGGTVLVIRPLFSPNFLLGLSKGFFIIKN